MKLERDKYYRTRDGWKARVIATDVKAKNPIIAVITDPDGKESAWSFQLSGMLSECGKNSYDIISEWRDEPLRVEFECHWEETENQYIRSKNLMIKEKLRPFLGKKTKVTIEEIFE